MAKQQKKRKNTGYHGCGLSPLQQASVIRYAKDKLAEGLTDRQCRRLEWIYFCLLAEKHQFTQEDLRQLDAEASAMVEEFEAECQKKGQDTADEALRQRVSLYWGEELDFGYPGNPDRSAALRESEGRIY
ncbi:MAG: hypothetical protein IJ960_06670 [Oscillospiraceae bacterium]|nr:hypothetical protein [Oscillospiraceae bacterium]